MKRIIIILMIILMLGVVGCATENPDCYTTSEARDASNYSLKRGGFEITYYAEQVVIQDGVLTLTSYFYNKQGMKVRGDKEWEYHKGTISFALAGWKVASIP